MGNFRKISNVKKCYVCGNDIAIDEADMFIKIGDNDYLCGQHYLKRNEITVYPETVEKLLEEKFGGVAIIKGESEFKIYY